MSIRVRLILVLLLVAIAPTLIIAFRATANMQDLAAGSSEAILEEVAKQTIQEEAETTAQQIESYLQLHPELDPSDTAALEANQELGILAVQPVGETGYTAVFDDEGVTHFHRNPEMVGMDMSTLADTLPEFWSIFAASLDGSPNEGYYDWKEPDGSIRQKFMATDPVGDTPLRVAATTYIDEFTQPAQAMTEELERVTSLARQRLLVTITLVVMVTLGVAFFFGNQLTAPLVEMAEAATQVVEGKWDAIQPSPRRDELGTLSRALHSMTERLQETVQGLERRVAERTTALERRARYLETTAAVARDAASELDLQRLLSRVVDLISKQFGFYHAGIFLLDPAGKEAELQAASSKGGQRMLARRRRWRVGEESIIGYVTDTGKPKIALDVGEDAVFFDNPYLPRTRSEIALPLRARGEIIGVLDVQSREPEAFGQEDVTAINALADQVAVAISNAQLFQQVQDALDAERQAYGEVSLQAWEKVISAQPNLGFLRGKLGISPVGDLWRPEMRAALRTGETAVDENDASKLAMPVKVRDQVIGVVDVRKPDDAGGWTEEEVAMMETLAEQLGVALESARLHTETQRRAIRERLVSEITMRMRETLDMDSVLKTAVRGMREALGLRDVAVQLDLEADETS